MGRFKVGLRCKGWVNSVILICSYRYQLDVITCRYFLQCKTCLYTSALNQMIHLNVST